MTAILDLDQPPKAMLGPSLGDLLEACGKNDPESLEDAIVWSHGCRCNKDARWLRGEKRVASFTRIMGPTAVEDQVKDIVTALQALGIPTFASCGGHPDKSDIWQNMPYVGVGYVSGYETRAQRLEQDALKRLIQIMRKVGYDPFAKSSAIFLETSKVDSKGRLEYRFAAGIKQPLTGPRRGRKDQHTGFAFFEAMKAQKAFEKLGKDLVDFYHQEGSKSCPCL